MHNKECRPDPFYGILRSYIHLHCYVILLNVLPTDWLTSYSPSTLKATVLDEHNRIQARLTSIMTSMTSSR